MKAEWIELVAYSAKQGLLVPMETAKDIPFVIRRVFFITQADPSVVRGRHAHLSGEQVLVCVQGSCTLSLSDGDSTAEFMLDRPDRALHIGPLQWEELSLSSDAVLLVLASDLYDSANYIEDRDDLIRRTRPAQGLSGSC